MNDQRAMHVEWAEGCPGWRHLPCHEACSLLGPAAREGGPTCAQLHSGRPVRAPRRGTPPPGTRFAPCCRDQMHHIVIFPSCWDLRGRIPSQGPNGFSI